MNWRKIADQLATRLAHHAYCDEHPEVAPDPGCPSCQDRTAYLAYVDAGGRNYREQDALDGRTAVSMTDLISRTTPNHPGGFDA